MTKVATKTPVEALWNIKKVTETNAKIWASTYLSAIAVLEKHGPEAIKAFEKEVNAHKVQYYKSLNLTSAIDLAKAVAETEANLFGSKLEIEGDEKKAQVIFKTCARFEAIKHIGKLSAKDEQCQGERFESCMKDFASGLGFKAETQISENGAIVTFIK